MERLFRLHQTREFKEMDLITKSKEQDNISKLY